MPTGARAGASGHVRAGRTMAVHVLRIGRSIGSPTDGHLVGGAHLDDAPYLRIVPNDAGGDVRWGIEPLVSLVDHAGREVRHQFPDAVLSVGHLSRAGGGELDRHASHESGRDVDLGFYIRARSGRPLYGEHFVAFRSDGSAPSWPGAYFDDARNWALVEALVTDPRARITHIFVAAPLRARLLEYAEKVGAPSATRTRAAELMAQPRGSLPHDDHFHVRIGCPAGMSGCIEQPTRPRGRRLAHVHSARAAAPASAVPHEPPARKSDHDAPPPPDPSAPEPGDNLAPPGLLEEPVEDVDGPLSLREPPGEPSQLLR